MRPQRRWQPDENEAPGSRTAEREKPTAESFLLCSKTKNSQEMEREKMRQHCVIEDENISSLMNHVPQHGYNTLRVIPTSHSPQKRLRLTSANHHLPSLLCCFLGIKTCTDFALSQEVTKVTSNNYLLTSLLLRFLLHPKLLEQWLWFNSTENTMNRQTEAAHTFPLGGYTVAGHGFQHFNQYLKFRK